MKLATIAAIAAGGAAVATPHSSPAACWLGHGIVKSRVTPGWVVQACIFERLDAHGRVVEQAGISRLGAPQPTQPISTAKPRLIFTFPRRNLYKSYLPVHRTPK
jgi:hypothetical protein